MLMIALLLTIGGCSKKADTVGATLQNAFKEDAKAGKSCEDIAYNLSENKVVDFSPIVMEVEEGWLNGFTSDITGFKKGYIVAPMIGSIPFVAYVFESDDPNALLESLKGAADPRWNICTEADETVYEVSGNLVFFAMVSNEE